MNGQKRVHFMGIGGSGMSAVAQIAHHLGFQVSGCDLQTDTPYIDKVKKAGIPIATGHDSQHLEEADILTVTPAVFYQNNDHPETAAARSRNILTKWQDFLGNHLQKNHFVISVAGTHGKSTTTAWIGHLLENADLDPIVEIGATDMEWHNNVRLGHGKYFVSEADEFHDNFASYQSDIVVLNNIEMDHPEYFASETQLLNSFQVLINNIKPGGHLIYNSDSPLIHKLKLPAKSLPYTFSEFNHSQYQLKLAGNHNKSNSLGVIKVGQLLSLSDQTITTTINSFRGVERRIQLMGKKNSIAIYDDYANHPTAFAASISAVSELNPNSRIWAVIEPHTFSRLRSTLNQLPKSVSHAYAVIVSQIFPSRESDPGDFTGQDIVLALHHPNARYIPEFSQILSTLKTEAKKQDVILVMGSGNSYKLSKQILESI